MGEWREMMKKRGKDGWSKVADKRRLRGGRDVAAAPWSRLFM